MARAKLKCPCGHVATYKLPAGTSLWHHAAAGRFRCRECQEPITRPGLVYRQAERKAQHARL